MKRILTIARPLKRRMFTRRAKRFSSVAANTRNLHKPTENEECDEMGHIYVDPNRPFRDYNTRELYLLCRTTDLTEAHEERLLREVMRKDGLSEDESKLKVRIIREEVSAMLNTSLIPYGFLMTTIFGFGVLSIPMVFNKNLALWFNDKYVTADIPPPEDLQTVLECGSWTWEWMEPWTGTFSFFILTMQYSKSFMRRMGLNAYKERMEQRRVLKMRQRYPSYCPDIMQRFVQHIKVGEKTDGMI